MDDRPTPVLGDRATLPYGAGELERLAARVMDDRVSFDPESIAETSFFAPSPSLAPFSTEIVAEPRLSCDAVLVSPRRERRLRAIVAGATLACFALVAFGAARPRASEGPSARAAARAKAPRAIRVSLAEVRDRRASTRGGR